MSLQGKNRAIYSYNNADCSGKNFMYKNFDKANCYHSNFRNTVFDGASLRATKFKYCNMSESHFYGTEFIGTNIRGSCLKNAVFKNAIITGVTADKADFSGCKFYHCILDGSVLKGRNLKFNPEDNIVLSNNSIFVPDSVLKCVEQIIQQNSTRNSVIQLKKGRVNRITLMMLLYDFSEDDLVKYLAKAVYESPRNCTVSRLKNALIKLKEADIM